MTVIGKITTTLVVLALVGAGCGGGRAQPPFDVVSTVVSHETTGQITVLEPEAEGPWPVVYMLHGIGGNRQEMEQLGRTVAEQGNVVFTLDWDARHGMDAVLFDLACSYNYGQSVAPDHGGDPHRTVAVGFSAGATYGLIAATLPEPDVTGGPVEPCQVENGKITPPDHPAPSPDVLVMIAPCLFEYEGQSFTTEPAGGNTDLRVTIVSGEMDAVCEPWQQRAGVELLHDAGFEATLVTVPDASHLNLVYRDEDDGEHRIVPDSPAGQRTTQAILDAVAAGPWQQS